MDEFETRVRNLETNLSAALDEIGRLTALEQHASSSAYESTPYSDTSALESRVEQMERDPKREFKWPD